MEKIAGKQGFHLIFSLSFFPGYEGQLVDFSSHDHLNKTTFNKKKKAKSAQRGVELKIHLFPLYAYIQEVIQRIEFRFILELT